MPSALASRGGILTCGWAGRPHHFYQALASGETIGYCMKETQNANSNSGFFASISGEGGAHTALLGDPTLRAHVVPPPGDMTATASGCRIQLDWAASPDTMVSGYHVYRSFEKYGAYTRLTTNTISETAFTDENPLADTLYYQVRAAKLQTSPGGGLYWNNSTGLTTTVARPQIAPLNVEIAGLPNCDFTANLIATATGGKPPYHYLWSTGDTTSAVNIPTGGTISLTVTDMEGCSLVISNFVVSPSLPFEMNAEITNASAPGANDGAINLEVVGGAGLPYTYFWSNGATTQDLENIPAGFYTVTITDVAGCTSIATVEVGATSGTDESAVFQQLLLSPNPTEGLVSLLLKLHKTATVQVSVHDATGGLVLEKPEMTASELALPIDLREKPTGMYTVFIFVEKQVFARKLAVLR